MPVSAQNAGTDCTAKVLQNKTEGCPLAEESGIVEQGLSNTHWIYWVQPA
jgi:hypothetical protein